MSYNSSAKEHFTTAMAFFIGAIVVAIVLWAVFAPFTLRSFVGFGMAMTATYILRYISSGEQLIRVRSWAVTSVFLITMAVAAPLHQWDVAVWMGACLYLIHLGALIASCQADKPQRATLLSAIALALLTMLDIRTLLILPMCVIAMIAAMRSMTTRTMLALIFGFLLPYEVWAAIHLIIGDLYKAIRAHWGELSNLALPTIEQDANGWLTSLCGMPLLSLCIMGTIVMWALMSIYYYSLNSYNDKIRTRLQYFTIMLEWPALVALLVFAPEAAPLASVLLIICSAPLMANYFVFSRGKFANTIFILFLILCIFLALRLL